MAQKCLLLKLSNHSYDYRQNWTLHTNEKKDTLIIKICNLLRKQIMHCSAFNVQTASVHIVSLVSCIIYHMNGREQF